MDCGAVFVKYVLFIFNILCAVCGILLITFGSIMVARMGDFKSLAQAWEVSGVPIIIIALGCVIFLIAFLGCCGAIRENACCTMTYSLFMLALFMLQLAVVIYVWTQHDKFLHAMEQLVETIWNQRKSDQKVMDALQLSFGCCGKNNFMDYGFEKLPMSCCGPSATTCEKLQAMSKPGCSSAFVSFWESNIDIVQYAGLGVAAIELIAFIFACCLANQVRNDYRRSNY